MHECSGSLSAKTSIGVQRTVSDCSESGHAPPHGACDAKERRLRHRPILVVLEPPSVAIPNPFGDKDVSSLGKVDHGGKEDEGDHN